MLLDFAEAAVKSDIVTVKRRIESIAKKNGWLAGH
jgi:hypothetical protein